MAREIIYSVFVSSTYEDLREERAAVQKALLQLHCMPIGMELFGSADEETWEFVKRQIDDCDYYVVIVADKYGSTADDGTSYTEMEYNYARAVKKPILGFVHGKRGGIPRDKTETDLEKRPRLEAFIQKVQRSPVSFFTSPDDLATQVTVSFVRLRERQPAVGFIRVDQTPDLKKYADLLEENARLRAELAKYQSPQGMVAPFPQLSEVIILTVEVIKTDTREPILETVKFSWGELLLGLAKQTISQPYPFNEALAMLTHDKLDLIINEYYVVRVEESDHIALRLIGWGLMEFDDRQLVLTEYGKRQINHLMS